MAQYGYTLFSELNGPTELVRQAVAAEDAGFDALVISDHFHPWLDSHTDSPFAWSVLGAVAHATQRIALGTLVTTPTFRYHPAVIAQAAATIACMSDGRFRLALGAGERLNEHVIGAPWPSVDVRHEMLDEAIQIITRLWSGGYHTFRGTHLQLDSARLFTLPEQPPGLAVAVSGPASIGLAARHGADMVAIEPDPELVQQFKAAAGDGARCIGQVAVSYDADRATAEQQAMRFAFGAAGWKVMAELPNVVNFEAAVASVRPEDVVGELVSCGPDPEAHLQAVQQFLDAGYDEIHLVQVADDKDGFLELWRDHLRPALT